MIFDCLPFAVAREFSVKNGWDRLLIARAICSFSIWLGLGQPWRGNASAGRLSFLTTERSNKVKSPLTALFVRCLLDRVAPTLALIVHFFFRRYDDPHPQNCFGSTAQYGLANFVRKFRDL
jgi:hypothetical protein